MVPRPPRHHHGVVTSSTLNLSNSSEESFDMNDPRYLRHLPPRTSKAPPSSYQPARMRTAFARDGSHYQYPEFQPNTKNIVKGFQVDRRQENKPPAESPVSFRKFPPPANEAYPGTEIATTSSTDSISSTISSTRASEGYSHSTCQCRRLEQSLNPASSSSTRNTQSGAGNHKSNSRKSLNTMSKKWSTEPNEETGLRLCWEQDTTKMSREDMENMKCYNRELCSLCMRIHIEPGKLITLAERDTCGAFLPEWVPIHLRKKTIPTYGVLIEELLKTNVIKADDSSFVLRMEELDLEAGYDSPEKNPEEFMPSDDEILAAERRILLEKWAENLMMKYKHLDGGHLDVAEKLLTKIPDQKLLSDELFPAGRPIGKLVIYDSDDDGVHKCDPTVHMEEAAEELVDRALTEVPAGNRRPASRSVPSTTPATTSRNPSSVLRPLASLFGFGDSGYTADNEDNFIAGPSRRNT